MAEEDEMIPLRATGCRAGDTGLPSKDGEHCLRNHIHSPGESNIAERSRGRNKKKDKEELFETDKDSLIQCTQPRVMSTLPYLWL